MATAERATSRKHDEQTEIMSQSPVLRMVDAVTVSVPDLNQGFEFYRDRLGHDLLWRNDELGQAGLRPPDSETELVLSTNLRYARPIGWSHRSRMP
jgi:catechol 2,3-dioxygenase-like lactoylglutathione lyase family enzyme